MCICKQQGGIYYLLFIPQVLSDYFMKQNIQIFSVASVLGQFYDKSKSQYVEFSRNIESRNVRISSVVEYQKSHSESIKQNTCNVFCFHFSVWKWLQCVRRILKIYPIFGSIRRSKLIFLNQIITTFSEHSKFQYSTLHISITLHNICIQ